jgi:hypothetical protein
MTAGDLAAVLVAVVCLVAVAALVLTVQSLRRSARALQQTVDVLRQETVPMVVDLRDTVQQANAELVRVDGILDRAERVAGTVDHATRLGFRAFSPPVIRTLSIVAGAGRATRRLRGRSPHDRVIDVSAGPTGLPAPGLGGGRDREAS